MSHWRRAVHSGFAALNYLAERTGWPDPTAEALSGRKTAATARQRRLFPPPAAVYLPRHLEGIVLTECLGQEVLREPLVGDGP